MNIFEESVTFPARMEYLYPSLEFVLSSAERGGIDDARRGKIEIAVEELLVNIYRYAYPDHPGEVLIRCGCAAEDRGDVFAIEISDRGIPFDILSVPQPDLSAGVEDRAIGRLGIYFVKNLMDSVRYRYEDGQNILTIKMNIVPQRESSGHFLRNGQGQCRK
jgi:serine/threonine-protein kinase RsbW